MARTTARIITKQRGRIRELAPRRPEAVGFSEHIAAHRWGRVLAFLLDGVLIHAALLLLGLAVPIFGSLTLSLLYVTLHDSARGAGRSLGRAAVKQRLMSVDGEEISHGRAAARNAVRWLLWLTVIPAFIDLLQVLVGDGRLIADLMFGTRVWEDPEHTRRRVGLDVRLEAARLRMEREAAAEQAAARGFMDEADDELARYDDPAPNAVARAELDAFEAQLGEAAGEERAAEAEVARARR